MYRWGLLPKNLKTLCSFFPKYLSKLKGKVLESNNRLMKVALHPLNDDKIEGVQNAAVSLSFKTAYSHLVHATILCSLFQKG